MAITTTPSLLRRIRRGEGPIVIAIKDPDGAVFEALQEAADALLLLSVNEADVVWALALQTPEGAALIAEGKDLDRPQRELLLRTIVEVLERQGVTKATLTTPRVWRFHPSDVPNAIWLHASPVLESEVVPVRWIEEAFSWLRAQSNADTVTMTLGGEYALRLPLRDAEAFALNMTSRDVSVRVFAGDMPTSRRREVDQLAAIAINTIIPALALAVGGSGLKSSDVDQHATALKAVGRRIAKTARYLFMSIDPDWGAYGSLYYAAPPGFPYLRPGAVLYHDHGTVVDGLHWQILSESHQRRLGSLPLGATVIGDHRWELEVGQAVEWWPHSTDDAAGRHAALSTVRARARELLSPCLELDPYP